MRQIFYAALFAAILICGRIKPLYAQEKVSPDQLSVIGDRWLEKSQDRIIHLQRSFGKRTAKYLKKQHILEAKLKEKIGRIDSISAHRLFANNYTMPLQETTEKADIIDNATGEYLPYLDSLKSSLLFLQQYHDKLSVLQLKKLKTTLSDIDNLKTKLRQSTHIKSFLQERQQQIATYLSENTQLPKSLSKIMTDYKKQTYYYAQQVKEYKEIWKHPERLQQKALLILNKMPAFQQFMKEHSELAGLFRLPNNYGSLASLSGLQTQSAVLENLQQFTTTGGPASQQLMQQNLQAAKGELDKMKGMINLPGNAGMDSDMPDFKPNDQKTKHLLKRLEYGFNIQTSRASTYFPRTTDIGLSLGYKLNDKTVAGIGASYRFGWGNDLKNLTLNSEGIGLRSFLDSKLKGNIYISGGFEYNYQLPFTGITPLKSFDKWQRSGLIGISKIVALKSKSSKKTSLQLLWDFLSYSQIPRTQPVKFRMGYKL